MRECRMVLLGARILFGALLLWWATALGVLAGFPL
jgi:hypothetical protein